MKQYTVVILPTAANDIESLGNVIKYDYKAPLTAFKYVQGLLDVIKSLKYSAGIFSVQPHPSLTDAYGTFVRRVNYKKMAILYTIHTDTVYILRVIPQSTISGL